jgi:hypothetical protein
VKPKAKAILLRLVAVIVLIALTAGTCAPKAGPGLPTVDLKVDFGKTTLDDIQSRFENYPGYEPLSVGGPEAHLAVENADIYVSTSDPGRVVKSVTVTKHAGIIGTVHIGIMGFYFDDKKEKFDRLVGPGKPISDTETEYKGDAPGTAWVIAWGRIENAESITYMMKQAEGGSS